MDTVLRLLFYEMLGLGLIATVVKSFGWRDYLKKRSKAAPTKLLRSPGETAQRETQMLNDWLMGLLAGIVATPAILLGQMPHTINGRAIAIMAAGIVLWAVPLIYLLNLRRRLELSLRGQRAVAEELNRLMREGCFVFHDYPVGPRESIDHIIVAPSGVYAIKTRTRRKSGALGGRDEGVTFDGSGLNFPHGYRDSAVVEQARSAAAELSRELAAASTDKFNVNAIVALPGWIISGTAKGDVTVLNPEGIKDVVVSAEKPLLSSVQMNRVAGVIEQKCRDIEL